MKKATIEIIRVVIHVIVYLAVIAVGDFMRDGTFHTVEILVATIIACVVSSLVIYFINKAKKTKP